MSKKMAPICLFCLKLARRDSFSPAIGRALFVDDYFIWLSASSTRAVERQPGADPENFQGRGY